MSTIGAQIDGIRTLSRLLAPAHLVRSGAVARKSEAEHLIIMLKDATETMKQANERGVLDE